MIILLEDFFKITGVVNKFALFENWIAETTGGIARDKILEFNNYILKGESGISNNNIPAALNENDLDLWNEQTKKCSDCYVMSY